MKHIKVTIVDYGVGNLYSVKRALEVCGARNICISGDPADIADADRLILPGVGSFKDGMQALHRRGLDQSICNYAESGGPLLGICLGMQLFSTFGDEFGGAQGLNLIPGRVQEMPKFNQEGERIKLPFIGWRSIEAPEGRDWSDSPLKKCTSSDSIYLVHSFQFIPSRASDLLAIYYRNHSPVTAAVQYKNIIGLQFHPEKSGMVGLKILENFLGQ